ncbi:MAG: hypothetical protein FJ137_08740 [Deltaproteobacteria bacterium]|nr:hypothetical protein [Deltaproteobacteria bacterium]
MPNAIWLQAAPVTTGKAQVVLQEDRAAELGAGGTVGAARPRSASLDDGGRTFLLKLPRRVTARADGRPY